MKPQDQERLIIVAAAAGGIWFLANKLGKLIPSFGAEDTTISRSIDQEAQDTTSPWNPAFYRNAPSGAYNITSAMSNLLVIGILNSSDPFYDDFSQVLGIFKQLKTQSQVSYLAMKFFEQTGQDLLTWLRGDYWPLDRFSAEQVQQLMNYVKKLPKYTP